MGDGTDAPGGDDPPPPSSDAERRASLRAFMAFAKLRETATEADALRLVFGDRAEMVMDALRAQAAAEGRA